MFGYFCLAPQCCIDAQFPLQAIPENETKSLKVTEVLKVFQRQRVGKKKKKRNF